MTKKELIEQLRDVSDDSEIDIYDLRNFSHPNWIINKESYFDYDKGTPIITIELS